MGAPDRHRTGRTGWALTPMIPPTIPVGTSGEVLISHHLQVLQKLDEAVNAMASIQPNGLDYITEPQYGPSGLTREVFNRATAAWRERFDMISAIRRDIEKIAVAIAQGRSE